jgi:ketol-acid reductoisomerase
MDWMYANCSATAQRGALDWRPKFRDAVLPVFEDLYARVKDGRECKRVLDSTGGTDYKTQLEKELKELREAEMWQAGATVRSLRPERKN